MSDNNEYIVVGFSTSSDELNPIPKLIRAVEGTSYSHTYIRFWSESLQRHLFYQASKSFLHFLPSEKFHKENIVIKEYVISVSKDQKTECLRYCVDAAGTKYGKMQLIGVAVARAANWIIARLGLPIPLIKNPLADGGRSEICSELVGNILIILGEKIDPQDLEYYGPKFIDECMECMVKKGMATII